MSTRGSLFEQAFEEFKVTRQVGTGNGAMYVAAVEYGGRIPGGFIRDELGYDGPVGTRLYVMVPQERIDRRHQEVARAVVNAPDAPAKASKKPRETRHSRRAKLEQLEARALARQYAA